MFQWDDLRVFLAAYRAASVTKAGERLHMSPSTVSRRLAALESALGAPLFARTPEGLVPTAAAEEILAHAEAAERLAERITNTATDARAGASGRVRVAISGEVASQIVIPFLDEFMAEYPSLCLEILIASDLADLTRYEADLAVRTVRPTTGEDLVSVRLRDSRAIAFASRTYLASRAPDTPIGEHRWIDWTEEFAHLPPARWVRENVPSARVVFRANDMRILRDAAAANLGVAILPEVLGNTSSSLQPLPGPIEIGRGTVWLVAHRATRNTPRVRAVFDFLVRLFTPDPTQDEVVLLRERLRSRYWND